MSHSDLIIFIFDALRNRFQTGAEPLQDERIRGEIFYGIITSTAELRAGYGSFDLTPQMLELLS